MEIILRKAVPGDVEQIDKFDPFAGDRHRDIREKNCIVALQAGKVVGYIVVDAVGFIGNPFVQYLAIETSLHRRGIATQLLELACSEFHGTRLFVSTEADNEKMLTLLSTKGWKAAGCVEKVNHNDIAECFFYRDL